LWSPAARGVEEKKLSLRPQPWKEMIKPFNFHAAMPAPRQCRGKICNVEDASVSCWGT